MSSSATQGQRATAPCHRFGSVGILAFFLFSGSAIGFPHLFLLGSSSLLQGIAMASTLIFIASSGLLITTQPHPARTAAVVGAIVALGGFIVGCCALIAPGILLAITVGLIYASAWVVVAATSAATTGAQLDHGKRMLAPQQVVWFGGIGLLGFLWLAMTLFSAYGWMAVFWLVYTPLIPWSVWLSYADASQSRQRSQQNKLDNVVLALLCLGVIIIASGKTLGQAGALVWLVEIIVLAFAVLTASFLELCVTQASPAAGNQDAYKFCRLFLLFVLVSGVWGYRDHFWQGVTVSERWHSLGSATLFDQVLVTQLWNQKITMSSDEQFLANGGESSTGNKEKIVQLWDLKTGKLTRTFSGYSDPSIVANASGEAILCMRSPSGSVERWHLLKLQPQQGNEQDAKLVEPQPTRPQPLARPRFLPRDAVLLAASADGKTLATGFDRKPLRNRILLWDTSSGKLLYSLSPGSASVAPGGYYSSVTFSPSGHLLASDPSGETNTGNIHLWRLPRH